MIINPLGFQLHIIILFWVMVLLLAIAIATLIGWLRTRSRSDYTDWGLGFAVSTMASIIVGVIFCVVLMPFDSSYWRNYEVTGHINDVTNVLTDGSGELTPSSVISLDGTDERFISDDVRLTTLDDTDVTLRCSKEWNYQAADRYTCKLISIND